MTSVLPIQNLYKVKNKTTEMKWEGKGCVCLIFPLDSSSDVTL